MQPDGPMSADVVQSLADDVRGAFGWDPKPVSELFRPAELANLAAGSIQTRAKAIVVAAVQDQFEAWRPGPLGRLAGAAHTERAHRQAGVAADLVWDGYAFERGWEHEMLRPGQTTWVDLYDDAPTMPERGPEVAGP